MHMTVGDYVELKRFCSGVCAYVHLEHNLVSSIHFINLAYILIMGSCTFVSASCKKGCL